MTAYVMRRSAGERERFPARWPQGLKDLVSACWAQDPANRPSFKEVLSRCVRVNRALLKILMLWLC